MGYVVGKVLDAGVADVREGDGVVRPLRHLVNLWQTVARLFLLFPLQLVAGQVPVHQLLQVPQNLFNVFPFRLLLPLTNPHIIGIWYWLTFEFTDPRSLHSINIWKSR